MPRTAKSAAAPKAKAAKDPNAPKRSLSAYMLFLNENRAAIKAANPKATFGELGRLGGEAWKSLTKTEKKPWEDKAVKDKRRYEAEKAKYEASKKESAAEEGAVEAEEE